MPPPTQESASLVDIMSQTTTTEAQAASPTMQAPFFNDFSRYPPMEKFMTIDGLLRSHAAETDQKPLVCFPFKGVSDFEEHTAKDLERYTNLAVQYFLRHGLKPAVSRLFRVTAHSYRY